MWSSKRAAVWLADAKRLTDFVKYFPHQGKSKPPQFEIYILWIYWDCMKLRNCRLNLLGNDSPGRLRGQREGDGWELDTGHKERREDNRYRYQRRSLSKLYIGIAMVWKPFVLAFRYQYLFLAMQIVESYHWQMWMYCPKWQWCWLLLLGRDLLRGEGRDEKGDWRVQITKNRNKDALLERFTSRHRPLVLSVSWSRSKYSLMSVSDIWYQMAKRTSQRSFLLLQRRITNKIH